MLRQAGADWRDNYGRTGNASWNNPRAADKAAWHAEPGAFNDIASDIVSRI